MLPSAVGTVRKIIYDHRPALRGRKSSYLFFFAARSAAAAARSAAAASRSAVAL